MSTTLHETEEERIVREEQEEHDRLQRERDGEIDLKPDPDTGQLLKMPRAAVFVDESDPGVLKLAFSGQIELNRADPGDVDVYNALKAGTDAELAVTVFVAGPRNSHRRDSEGNVDAVVQTKSLIVHSIETGT